MSELFWINERSTIREAIIFLKQRYELFQDIALEYTTVSSEVRARLAGYRQAIIDLEYQLNVTSKSGDA